MTIKGCRPIFWVPLVFCFPILNVYPGAPLPPPPKPLNSKSKNPFPPPQRPSWAS